MEVELAETLRTRIKEFGDKPSYVLFPEELARAIVDRQFIIKKSEERRDGTLVTEVMFEGKSFLCVTERS